MISVAVLAPALKVAGVAIASEFISKLMEDAGHGGKVVFVKITAYVGCGLIAMSYWWDGVRYIAHAFGVSI